MAKKEHILPERLRPGLKLVFCGTAAGKQSALRKAYYANRQNKFWKTLFDVGLTPRQFEPHEYPLLCELDIGLTDIAKFAFGMDHQLPPTALGRRAADHLRARISEHAPHIIAFTSLNAGRRVMGRDARAGKQKEKIGNTTVWILTSPSPLAANHWSIKPWRDLAKAVQKLSG